MRTCWQSNSAVPAVRPDTRLFRNSLASRATSRTGTVARGHSAGLSGTQALSSGKPTREIAPDRLTVIIAAECSSRACLLTGQNAGTTQNALAAFSLDVKWIRPGRDHPLEALQDGRGDWRPGNMGRLYRRSLLERETSPLALTAIVLKCWRADASLFLRHP